MVQFFTTGSSELDNLLSTLNPKTMLLIVGHPGAGKTTLASKMCYENALRNMKCLYISFYEDRDKLFRNMSRLGILLHEVETRNLFTHVKIPVAFTDEVLNTIMNLVTRDTYRVVVIDSINPIIEIYGLKSEARAILLNFFYQLTNIIDGLLITVAELPTGLERIEFGAIEFVSDIILYLKHRVINGLLHRVMEIRKHREAPLNVVEISYSIIENEGFRIYPPPRIERILKVSEHGLKTTLSINEELVGRIYGGDVVFISYPSSAREATVIIPIIDLAVTNNLKTLAVSYKYSIDEIRELAIEVSTKYLDLKRDDVIKILNKFFYIVSYNPASYSINQLQANIIKLIEDLNPGMVVFHGVDILHTLVHDIHDYWSTVVNTLFWLRNRGIVVFRMGARVAPIWTRMNEAISDVIVRIYYKRLDTSIVPVFYVWRRGARPRIYEVNEKDIVKTIEDAKRLREKLNQLIT